MSAPFTLQTRPFCCWGDETQQHGCDADPEWVIYHGDGPDDYTHACTAHVGEMLTDAYEHRIYPIGAQLEAAQQNCPPG